MTKTSPPSAAPSNYWPISLLSTVSKLLEKHIAHIFLNHLFTHNLIPPSFIPNHSTIDALISACQSILTHELFFFCLWCFSINRKAFDSINHSALLENFTLLHFPLISMPSFLHTLKVRLNQCASESLSQHLILFFQVSPRVQFLVCCSSLPFKLMRLSFSTPLLLLICFCTPTIFFSYTLSTIQLTFFLSTLNSTPFPLGYFPSSTLLSQSICTSLFALNHILNNHLPPVKISVYSIERVGSFKFLDVLLKPNLYILDRPHYRLKNIKKTLGLIYWHFYKHCTHDTLMLLYKTRLGQY